MAIKETLSTSTQSSAEIGRTLDISLSGTWTGTVELQRLMGGTWMDTGDSWTANAEAFAQAAGAGTQWRVDFTRSTGDLVVNLVGGP